MSNTAFQDECMCRLLCFLISLLTAASAVGFYDNRYFAPEIYQRSRLPLIIKPFWMQSTHSYGEYEDDEWGLFEVTGKYDQKAIDDSLLASGLTDQSLFRSDWRGLISTAPWGLPGFMEAYGLAAQNYMQVCSWMGFGVRGSVMHVRSYMDMIRDPEPTATIILGPGDERDIFLERGAMHDKLGLVPAFSSRWGLTDIELYLHAAITRDYYCKCRSFDAGFSLGLLVPTSPVREINNPAALPFDGDGHFGAYIAFEGDFEVKEDTTIGFVMNLSKRFPKTVTERMPTNSQPYIFGPLQGPVNITPGLTFAFAPYLIMDGLRHGLGIRAAYSLLYHRHDQWIDLRSNQDVQSDLKHVEERTCWGREYFSIGAVYDWAYDCPYPSNAPRTTLMWDIPIGGWFVVHRAYKTQGVSITVEWEY